MRSDLYSFGVVVQTYTDIPYLNIFKIDKCRNIINIGCDHYYNSHKGTNAFSSEIIIGENLYIQNTNEINIKYKWK
jgi:hypothetical protein